MSFAHGQSPMSPAEAKQDHLEKTIAKHGIGQVASLPKRIAAKGLADEEKQLRLRHSDLCELGETRAVECVEEALHAIHNARQFLAASAESASGEGGR